MAWKKKYFNHKHTFMYDDDIGQMLADLQIRTKSESMSQTMRKIIRKMNERKDIEF